MNNSENTNMSIAEATYTAIKQGGEEVLQNPHRLLSFLIDMAPESPALTVLERNCDQELLEPFAEVVCGEQPPTLQSLQIAASRAHDMLVHTRAVSAEPSHQAIQQLGAGIMRYLTERSNAPLAPTPSQTAPQAPTVAPEPQPNPTTVTPTPDEHISQDSQGTWPAVSDAPAYNDVPDQIVPAPETDLSSSAGFPAQGAGAPMALHPQPTSEPEPPVAPVQPAAKPGRKKLVLLIAAIAAAAAVVAAIVMTTMRVTVYFESGGGSGSRMSVKTWKNSTIELPKSEYTRDGYTFTGWTLDGDTYHPGDSFTPSQQCSFTAAW